MGTWVVNVMFQSPIKLVVGQKVAMHGEHSMMITLQPHLTDDDIYKDVLSLIK